MWNGDLWNYQKFSKDIQGKIEKYNLYQKRSESIDKKRDIIYRLEQMWSDWDVISSAITTQSSNFSQ